MSFTTPHLSSPMTVEPGWIDYNGHLNMAFYNVLFDRAIDEVFATFGLGPDYAQQAKASYFTLEAHVTYIRELHVSDRVAVHSQLLDFDARRTHFFQELHHADQDFLAATCELVNMHVDMAAKRAAPFPPGVLAKIAAMHEQHKTLPVKPQVGHVIAIPRPGNKG